MQIYETMGEEKVKVEVAAEGSSKLVRSSQYAVCRWNCEFETLIVQPNCI